MSTFTFKNPISVGETVQIKNDCVSAPIDYILSDDQHATVQMTLSGSSINATRAGEINIIPLGGNCTISTAKTLVINNDNGYFTEQGIQDIVTTEMVGVFIIGILVFIKMLGR